LRVVVIGNSGGGKSTLARQLSSATQYRHVEIDGLLWQAGWELSAVEYYNSEHARLIAEESWIIDGLGRQESIPERLARSTDIFLVDMPLWIHFWFAAERQIRWAEGTLEHPPAGLTKMPPTEGLFRAIWEVDRDWMPEIRRLVAVEEQQGKRIVRLGSVADLNKFAGSS
jgi:adenylate kinase family enzyme